MRLFFILVLGLATIDARADEDPVRVARGGRKMKIAGIVLTSIGLAAGAVAIGTGAYFSTACQNASGDCYTDFGALFVSLPIGLIGLTLVGAGVPLWVVGAREQARARRLSVGLAPLRGGGVASLALAF